MLVLSSSSSSSSRSDGYLIFHFSMPKLCRRLRTSAPFKLAHVAACCQPTCFSARCSGALPQGRKVRRPGRRQRGDAMAHRLADIAVVCMNDATVVAENIWAGVKSLDAIYSVMRTPPRVERSFKTLDLGPKWHQTYLSQMHPHRCSQLGLHSV